VVVYLDSSALVKLVLPEPETSALLDALDDAELLVSSIVAAVEVPRAARRLADRHGLVDERAEDVIDSVELLWLDTGIVSAASRLSPVHLRSLDAIHLASGLSLGGDLTSFVAYDRRLLEAAREQALPVLTPGYEDASRS
jgi:predicted nucleic acid-binding protein